MPAFEPSLDDLIVAGVAARIAIDPVFRSFPKPGDHGLRGTEIHVCSPQRQQIVALDAGREFIPLVRPFDRTEMAAVVDSVKLERGFALLRDCRPHCICLSHQDAPRSIEVWGMSQSRRSMATIAGSASGSAAPARSQERFKSRRWSKSNDPTDHPLREEPHIAERVRVGRSRRSELKAAS